MRFDQMPADWPNRRFARRIVCRPHDWCVLEMGQAAGTAPTLLMLHGAGGSGHSFRNLIPLLEARYHLVVPDLPGQGFTRSGNRMRLGLDGMAEDLARLCAAEGWQPDVIVGHSAGGAIALRMAECLPLCRVVGINAALGSFEGVAGVVFPAMARMLSLLPLVPQTVARLWGTQAKVASLLASTGSKIEAAGEAQYLSLVRDAAHIDGTLAMMAQWQLDGLLSRLPRLEVATLLLAGLVDTTVPAAVSQRAAARMPRAEVVTLPGLAHLMHEDAPEVVADALLRWLA